MRREKRWRYYCDFCKKSGGSGAAMERHERGCTANPGRDCGLCARAEGGAGLVQQPIADLIAALGSGSSEEFAKLKELAEGCPACILAAIRQSGVKANPGTPDSNMWAWDFKKALAEFWLQVDDETEREYYS